jgi:hypothetical protein
MGDSITHLPEAQPPAVVGTGGCQVIQLSGNQSLVISRANERGQVAPLDGTQECIQLLDASGVTSLTIRLTPAGPVVELAGASLALKVDGDLALAARRIHLHGSETVSVTSGAEIALAAAGTLTTEGRRQNITATHGDVSMYANDDVKIDGERIRMNC